MVHSARPKCVAAICDGVLFPLVIHNDSFFVKRFASLSTWRLSKFVKRLPISERLQTTVDVNEFKDRLGFVDDVFNHPMVTCAGCNEAPCVCHYKIALNEFQRNGKRQITGGSYEQ